MKDLHRHAAASVILSLVLSGSIAHAQTLDVNTVGSVLSPADTYFASQTSLGTPYQVDSGRQAQTKGTTEAIRSYAQLMVSSHITVNNALEAILKRKAPLPPPTLLQAAYATMIWTLQHETGQTFDADYVTGQVNYQRGNCEWRRSRSEDIRETDAAEDPRPFGPGGEAAEWRNVAGRAVLGRVLQASGYQLWRNALSLSM